VADLAVAAEDEEQGGGEKICPGWMCGRIRLYRWFEGRTDGGPVNPLFVPVIVSFVSIYNVYR
jgi:hypothetical protein